MLLEQGLAIISTLITLAIPILLVVLIVRTIRGRTTSRSPTEPAGTMARRLIQYAALFGALMISAAGIIGLLQAALETDPTVARDASDVAVPISLTLVGIPLFLGLATWTRRRLDDPSERDSVGWLLYLTVTLIVALVAGIITLSSGLTWLIGGDGDAATLAAAGVWISIWVSHWWLGGRYPPADGLRFQRLTGSLITLWTAAAAAIGLGSSMLTRLYDEAYRETMVATTGDDLRRLAPIVAVAALAWWWYWLRHAVHDKRTNLWHAYVLLGGVLPGLMITLVAVGIGVFAVLEWAFGAPEGSTADHFSVLAAAFSAAVVGGSVLAYHRSLIRRVGAGARSEVVRVYEYLVAATGLAATAVGIAMLIVAFIQAIVPDAVAETGTAGDAVLLAVTLLLIGAPVWARSWSRVQRLARKESDEASSPSRRIYLIGLFGVGGLTAIISLIVILAISIEDILEGTAGWETLFAIRVPLALLLTVGVIAGYHWLVFRRDRAMTREVPEEPRLHIRSVLVVGSDAPELRQALAEATHARIQVWQRLDNGHATVDADDVAARVVQVDAESVMVVIEPDGEADVFPVALPG
jgi:preprotein translocase subunit Sss1